MSQAIDAVAGFEAILTHHSITAPQVNKLNPGKAPEYYALLAFPAAAQQALWSVLVEKAQQEHNLSANFAHGIKTNQSSQKPIVGVPGDSIMVRAASQYAPEIYDADGSKFELANPAHIQAVKSKFHAGCKVRAILTPFGWNFQGKKGVSFNLTGLMFVPSDAQRLNIGGPDVGGAFKRFAQPGAGGATGNLTGNPGGADSQSVHSQTSQPTFAGAAGTQQTAGNPFQQNTGAAAQGANPFA